jgi:transcription antitermination factor NusG
MSLDTNLQDASKAMKAIQSQNPEQPRGWWAAYTKHQHEKTVAQLLAIKGAEVFLPLYSEARRWKDRRVNLTLPLFPGYVFVRENPDLRLAVLATPGVFLIVTNGSRVAVIPDAELQNVRRAVEGPRGIQPHPFLNVGERVRIICGPLTGVEGILLRRKNVSRLILSVEMLAQSASLEVNEWEIASVSMLRASSPQTSALSTAAPAGRAF